MTNSTVATNANTIFDIPYSQIYRIKLFIFHPFSDFGIVVEKANSYLVENKIQFVQIPSTFENLKHIVIDHDWSKIYFEYVDNEGDTVQKGIVANHSLSTDDRFWTLSMSCKDASSSSSIISFWSHYFGEMNVKFLPFYNTLYSAVFHEDIVQFEQFYNADSYCIAMRIRGCKRHLVRTKHEYVIVDRDSYTNTWFSGDYLGHTNFKQALQTLRKWEK